MAEDRSSNRTGEGSGKETSKDSEQENREEERGEALERVIQELEEPAQIDPDEISSEEAEIIRLMASSQRISGPLPSPEIFKAYQDLSPDIGQWILESATAEREHRHWKEKAPFELAKRGQTIAASIAFLVIGIGGYLLITGRSTEGLVTTLVPLSILLGIFVYQQIKTRDAEVMNHPRDPQSESDE